MLLLQQPQFYLSKRRSVFDPKKQDAKDGPRCALAPQPLMATKCQQRFRRSLVRIKKGAGSQRLGVCRIVPQFTSTRAGESRRSSRCSRSDRCRATAADPVRAAFAEYRSSPASRPARQWRRTLTSDREANPRRDRASELLQKHSYNVPFVLQAIGRPGFSGGGGGLSTQSGTARSKTGTAKQAAVNWVLR